MLTIRTILHPTRFSDVDRGAFRLAASLSRAHGARLAVLHVMRPWYVHGRAEMLGAFFRQREELWNALNQLGADSGMSPAECRLASGDPAAEILQAAAEIQCDLIVMGRRGRSGLRRFLKGSTAEAVVRKATCPVLTVPPWHRLRSFSREPRRVATGETEVRTGRMPRRLRKVGRRRPAETGGGAEERFQSPRQPQGVPPWPRNSEPPAWSSGGASPQTPATASGSPCATGPQSTRRPI